MYINEYVCCGAEIIDVNQLYFNLKEREREPESYFPCSAERLAFHFKPWYLQVLFPLPPLLM